MSTAPVKEVINTTVYVPMSNEDVVDLYHTMFNGMRWLTYDNTAPDWHDKYHLSADEAFEAAGDRGSVTKVRAWKTPEGYFLIPSKLTKVEVK